MTKLGKILLLLTFVALVSVAGFAADPAAKKSSKTTAKVAAPAPAESSTPQEYQWLAFDSGLAKAKAEKKAVIVDFYTTWCGWCKRMDATTFRDTSVLAILKQNFVGVRVNGEGNAAFVTLEGEKMSERQLTQTFAVSGFPTYWFLDSDGKKIGPAPGYKPADAFAILLKYVGEGHYKTMSYDSFIKKETGKG